LDGGKIIEGKGNASIPSSSCFGGSGSWPAFGGTAEDRAAIIAGVEEGLAPFDITVITEAPPLELPHDLVLVGGAASDYGLEDIQGHSCDVDCLDRWRRNVVAVFPEEIDSGTDKIVSAILHELGHAWGLNHVDGRDHIMYKSLTEEVQTWSSECTPISREWCSGTHCGSGQQDSLHALLDRFGPPSVDTAPPTISFLAPLDGDFVMSGAQLEVVVDVGDDRRGYGWALRSPMLAEPVVAYELGQTSVWIDVPAPGIYTLEATVVDQAGKSSNAVIEIEATESFPNDTSSGSDTSSTGDTGRVHADTNDASGCACRARSPRGASGMWFAVLAFGAARRRRPTS
jgi:hypothetical protein